LTLGWKQLLLLLLLLDLLLLLKMVCLRHVVLRPFQAGIWKIAASHASENHGNHVWRDSAAQRRPQHVLLYLSLL
jgi:hypothetical protein